MVMLPEIIRFEIAYRVKQPMFYLFALFIFLMGFAPVATDSVQVGEAIGNVARNAPYVIANIMGSLSAIGLIIVTVFVTGAINRDHELKVQELFFSTRLNKFSYIIGRFFGSVIPTIIIMLFGAFGIWAASLMPWQDPARIASFSFSPYLNALILFVIPNLLFAGALFFSVTTLTRRVLWGWITVIVFFSLWGFSLSFFGDLEHERLAALIDPFALAPLRLITKYWTTVEKNTLLVPASGILLLNRLIWSVLGMGILIFTWMRYSMTIYEVRDTRSKSEADTVTSSLPEPSTISSLRAEGRPPSRIRQWAYLTISELRGIVRGLPFIVIILIGIMNLTGNLFSEIGGTESYPVTRIMIRHIAGGYDLMLFLVVVVYGGALIWKERRAGIFEVTDTLPIPNWMPLTSKIVALSIMLTIATVVAMITTMLYQTFRGYHAFEPMLYMKGLFLVSLSKWILVAVLALTIHVFTNNRNLGFLFMVLYFLSVEILPEIGVEHRMFYYGEAPRIVYSDMNGYGPYLTSLIWYRVYWGVVAAGLILLANLFWVRGTDNRPVYRLREAWIRLTSRRNSTLLRISLGGTICGIIIIGGWIYYNTTVINEFHTDKRDKELRVLYETRYKQYEGLSQPRIKDVYLEADIHPEACRVDLRGELTTTNDSHESISDLHVILDPELEINHIDLPPHSIVTDDREIGYRICRLESPLEPGDSLILSFDFTVQQRGFRNNDPNIRIVENGTFFDNDAYVPRFGYHRRGELADPHDRKDFDLPPRSRELPVDDADARMHMAYSHNADWINYEAVISTTSDQIAITPGYLEREWTENGRRFFHYRMDTPIVNFYSIQSGRYSVARNNWNDVAIEIYYHPRHGFNVHRIIESIQKSLEYYTTWFGPYQFRQVRIIEFPAYRHFAQSFPNTIPYSESAEFINDLRDNDNVDMVFFITAHEVSHQWWGHQVMGADVQGANFVVESLAQYSSLMVMKHDYSPEELRKYLDYERNRYLRGRSSELVGEQPLMLVETQPYIYYNKGCLALYALQEYIGEEKVNEALRSFLSKHAFEKPPYANSLDLIEELRSVTPPEYAYLIADLFESITLYDNRALAATAKQLPDGRYEVVLTIRSRKLKADDQGIESEVEHADIFEIGVFGAKEGHGEEAVLYLEKHSIGPGTSEVTITVDELPKRVGIDPRNLLIDRVSDDNCIAVSI